MRMVRCICLFICTIAVCYSHAQSDTTKGKVVYGVASYYARSLEGTQTTTGEIFSHNQSTAASNKFPLGTWVRVTNLRNGRSVIVRINDRMSKAMERIGRVVDLTRTDAAKLGYINRGLARVKVEEVPEGAID